MGTSAGDLSGTELTQLVVRAGRQRQEQESQVQTGTPVQPLKVGLSPSPGLIMLPHSQGMGPVNQQGLAEKTKQTTWRPAYLPLPLG